MKHMNLFTALIAVIAVMFSVSGCNAEDASTPNTEGNEPSVSNDMQMQQPKGESAAADVSRSGRIAVLDLGLIINTCDACKKKLEDLQNRRDSLQKEFMAKREAFDQKQTEIKRKKTVMTEEEFKKEVSAFEEDLRKEETAFQEKQAKLMEARNTALDDLRKQIVEVIAEMAATEKIALILNRQETILADSKLDITEAVLKRVNEVVKD